jgi:thiamine-phosphate pyrophosphorylase
MKKLSFDKVFFTNRKRCDDLSLVIKKLPKNSAVIFREYDLESKEREILAQKLFAICQAKNHKFLIGKNLELARKLRADGVHFSDKDLLPLEVFNRQNWPEKFIFSFACHNFLSVIKSQQLGADMIFVSPIIASKSHPDVVPLGLRELSRIVRVSKIPVFALGGVGAKNIHLLKKLGVAGFGGIGIFCEDC